MMFSAACGGYATALVHKKGASRPGLAERQTQKNLLVAGFGLGLSNRTRLIEIFPSLL